MPCYSPLKGYVDPETGGIKFKGIGTEETMEVACGQCIGCRLDRSRMWAIRMVHEASLYESGNGSIFATLTYNDANIPSDWGLSVPERVGGRQVAQSDFQAFMKRLRKSRKGEKIKYYMCGEYGNVCPHKVNIEEENCTWGCTLGRPHYHAAIFNVRFDDLIPFGQNRKTGDIHYTSEKLEKLWSKGFVQVGNLTTESAGYVARYVMKKVTGDLADDHYTRVLPGTGEVIKVAPEYSQMSNGLGAGWYERYKGDVFPSDEVPVEGRHRNQVVKKAPRYYEEKLKQEDPEGYEEVKQRRQEFRDANAEEYTSKRLMDKYKVKEAAIRQLQRNKAS